MGDSEADTRRYGALDDEPGDARIIRERILTWLSRDVVRDR